MIVESIWQLLESNPNNRILVCATSNGSTDEIALRLLAYCAQIPNCQHNSMILRLFAKSRERYYNIDPKLRKISNFNKVNTPKKFLDVISKYRVVFSTLATSGRMMVANLEPNFFTHLFIDESHSANEVHSLIPIAGN